MIGRRNLLRFFGAAPAAAAFAGSVSAGDALGLPAYAPPMPPLRGEMLAGVAMDFEPIKPILMEIKVDTSGIDEALAKLHLLANRRVELAHLLPPDPALDDPQRVTA